MTKDQFNLEFEILNGYFDRSPKKATASAWFREIESYDIDIFRQVVSQYADQQVDNDGKRWFPHVSEIKSEYNRVKAGQSTGDSSYVPGCQSCDHGKIYLERFVNGRWSQAYVFRCGECDPWQLKQFPPMFPVRLEEYQAKGWRLEWTLQDKWDKIAAGTWKPESEKSSPAQVGALLRGMGYGKENKAKEAKRQQKIEESESR